MTPPRITWMETALQGLAFWIGHRRALFRHYPLPEGALVAEACNLLQANKPDDLVLKPECMYKNLVPTGRLPKDISSQARADLVVCNANARQADRSQNISDLVKFVLEVKRGDAPKHLINEDLRRLQSFLRASSPDIRAFLLIASEANSPNMFVEDGKAIRRKVQIAGSPGHFMVRRTLKASGSFSGKTSAHYVCLVELFAPN
jgi:hypothetical protein